MNLRTSSLVLLGVLHSILFDNALAKGRGGGGRGSGRGRGWFGRGGNRDDESSSSGSRRTFSLLGIVIVFFAAIIWCCCCCYYGKGPARCDRFKKKPEELSLDGHNTDITSKQSTTNRPYAGERGKKSSTNEAYINASNIQSSISERKRMKIQEYKVVPQNRSKESVCGNHVSDLEIQSSANENETVGAKFKEGRVAPQRPSKNTIRGSYVSDLQNEIQNTNGVKTQERISMSQDKYVGTTRGSYCENEYQYSTEMYV